MANKKLGKGLEAIFGSDVNTILDEIQNNASSEDKNEINIDLIHVNPYQPRKHFDQQAIDELASSIATHGVFTPILVRESLNGYELIAGERRFRASKQAGLKTIPAIIRNFSDEEMMEIAILENIQRENLSAIEEANGYAKLMENLNYTQEQVAQRVGKSRVYVTNLLRLLNLPASVQTLINDGKISNSTARALLSLKDENKIEELANKIVKEGLSTREVEQLVKEKQKPGKPIEKKGNPYLTDVANRLQEKFATKVTLTNKTITINYNDNDDLNRILEILDALEQ